MVTFKASVFLQSLSESGDDTFKDPYLPSGIPASMNILEPLTGSRDSLGREPRLSVSRLSGAQPVRQDPRGSTRSLKVHVSNAFRALPAIASRVRYHKPTTILGKGSLIASLDLECAPFSDDAMEVSSVEMQLSDGTVEDLVAAHLPLLPLTCRPKDSTVFLFRLLPNNSTTETSSSSLARTVEIKVKATVRISDECLPKIHMSWRTGVDMATALNPTYGTPGQSMQRSKRPTSLPVGPSSENVHKADEDQPTRESKTRQRAISISDLGVTVTFTAPKHVPVGKQFALDVLVLNGSSRPRRFALNAVPQRRTAEAKAQQLKQPSSSPGGSSDAKIAKAVVDENVLYALQKTSIQDSMQIISLSTDVRIG